MSRILLLIFLLVLAAACVNDELCTGNSYSEINMSFFTYGAGTSKSITLDSLGVSGDPEDYTIYADSTLSKIRLAVDPDSTQTLFVFFRTERIDTLDVAIVDTLDISYKVTPSLISVHCGPELLFSNLDTVYHTFDSLVIVQKLFNREVETNLEVYF